ncbi:sigma 54-interacting transcriptional regulator [Sulfidibacter corallicola]
MLEIRDGLVHFGGRRALIFDPMALGILRKELVRMFGTHVARGLLMRMGYYHGWVTAQNLKDDFPWDDDGEWRRAGARLHQLQGHVLAEVPEDAEEREDNLFAWCIWKQSYEAEQHILHLGQDSEPVCWALTGFASGYMSQANGEEILAREVRCRGKGDPVCYLVAKRKSDWGDEAEELEAPILSPCLDHALQVAAEKIKKLENKLRNRSRWLEDETLLSEKIIGRSPAMLRAMDLAKRVAKVDSVVLITGESGVGKERFARLIHEESARFRGPFVAVNCGAVTESLLESELFGHKRGAFTGATQDRPGLFEAAAGGTLFLDEIGELPQTMQVKLLRVLQEREVRRVGENHSRAIDVRLIAATNRDLAEEVAAGRFRQDLYYRLKVIGLRLPPLRERRADILPLARHFLRELCERLGRDGLEGFHPEAADQLQRHTWPGNVRELQNAVEHAVVLAFGNRIGRDDLPEDVRGAVMPNFTASPTKRLADIEREVILSSLAAHEGNQTHTAKALGIGTATLYRKLKAYTDAGFRLK